VFLHLIFDVDLCFWLRNCLSDSGLQSFKSYGTTSDNLFKLRHYATATQ